MAEAIITFDRISPALFALFFSHVATATLLHHKAKITRRYATPALTNIGKRGLRLLLEKVIQEGDNLEYEILSYIIMPNHVHLLIRMLEDNLLRDSLMRIKGKSSFQINRVLGRKGSLWQRESYDRMIRNVEHLNRCIEYIRNNPKNLPPDTYTYFRSRGL